MNNQDGDTLNAKHAVYLLIEKESNKEREIEFKLKNNYLNSRN